MTIAGLRFPNRIGLAAGLDKNGRCIDAFGAMGFGFVEVGTVTPLAQPGNPKPRMFRLPEADALINRLGFNNDGLAAFVANVRRARFRASGGILGLNIGKNAATPIERAADDYLTCLAGVYPHADYVTVNISSPNTQNLRDAAGRRRARRLARRAAPRGATSSPTEHGRTVPMFLKIAPDLDAGAGRGDRRDAARATRSTASIATNTTLSRDGGRRPSRTARKAAACRARRLLGARTASSRVCAPPSGRAFRSSASAASCRAPTRGPSARPAPTWSRSTPASSTKARHW